ncbi:MAG: transposase [Chitinophagaceae bacterium]|nr:transposase [Chitinophagaceae bacterium]
MKLLGIVKGKPVELGLKEEQALTHIFKDIIIENNYKCLAYNICKDHVHLILVCAENELTGIVQKLKSVSSKLLNRWCMSHLPPPPMGHDPLEYNNNPLEYTYNPLEYTYNPLENNYNPLEHNNHLWSQKFFSANMDDWQLMELSNIPGHVYKATYTQML